VIGWLKGWLASATARRADSTLAQARWVVIDVETTGLDPARDEVLALAAVAIVDGRLQVADSLEIAVRPGRASGRDNILVHGIGAGAQLAGIDPAQAARELRDHLGDAALVAWHAAFDRAFLERLLRRSGLAVPSCPWIDLAELAPAILPQARAHTLDEWLSVTGTPIEQRHQAASDAWATAMLFARLLGSVPAAERTPRALARRIDQARWLSPRS
jgi:DNA polymerase-3 subunit epsilon